jgi:cysteine synthase A
MATYAETVTELIGNTPMVKLNRVVPKESVAAKVLVKLEMQNPGGSIKDRIALSMIEEAEKRGEISPGKTTIVEATSGNTGIGLAMVAAAKGYKCLIVMPQVPPMYERYIIDRKFGSQVHLT